MLWLVVFRGLTRLWLWWWRRGGGGSEPIGISQVMQNALSLSPNCPHNGLRTGDVQGYVEPYKPDLFPLITAEWRWGAMGRKQVE